MHQVTLNRYIKKLWRSNYDPMGLILKKSHLFGLITKDIIHVGDFRADIIVEGKVIIELKAISELNKSHHIQLVNYLTATRIDDGFLINYGAEDYRIIHKTRLFDRSYRSKNQVQE